MENEKRCNISIIKQSRIIVIYLCRLRYNVIMLLAFVL